jgi:DNA-binding Lrp family transcriptional regulator
MLNKIDAIILTELLQDGRKNFTAIAKKLRVSKKTIWKHYTLMKQNGVIVGSTLHLNYRKLGFKTVVNIFGSVKNKNLNQIMNQVQKMPNIYSVFPNRPERNLGICALLKDIVELEEIRNHLRHKFNVQKMKTFSWLAIKNFPENLKFHPDLEKDSIKSQFEYKKLVDNKTGINELLDEIDRKIIEKLGINSRISIRSLSKEIKVSQDTISKRYKKLIEKNIIKSVIQINPKIVGYKAFPSFSLAFSSKVEMEYVIDYLINIPDVMHIIITSGEFELIVYAFVRSIEQFLEIKEKILKIKELTNMEIEIYNILPIWPTPNQYISTF